MNTPSPSASASTANADQERNLDGFFSFLGITAAVLPVLLCIAYVTRRRHEERAYLSSPGANNDPNESLRTAVV